ncbi:MAG: nucleoside diphosphate kinase regulator [Pseudobdellovibrio sp.]
MANKIIITETDYQKISSLVYALETETTKLLEGELDRAEIVEDEALPKDVVAMNSIVKFKDLEDNSESSVTLVYPHEANIELNKVSVLAPIGAALIGLRVGETINWPMPNGKKKSLKVEGVNK